MDIEQRVRDTVERIVGDSSLTDDLNDAEAMRLLQWGEPLARQLAMRTMDMDSMQIGDFLDGGLKNLRRVMRRVNKLVGMAGDASPEEMTDLLHRIFEAAGEIPGLAVSPPEDVTAFAQQIKAAGAAEALTSVLGVFAVAGAEAEAAEPEPEASVPAMPEMTMPRFQQPSEPAAHELPDDDSHSEDADA